MRGREKIAIGAAEYIIKQEFANAFYAHTKETYACIYLYIDIRVCVEMLQKLFPPIIPVEG